MQMSKQVSRLTVDKIKEYVKEKPFMLLIAFPMLSRSEEVDFGKVGTLLDESIDAAKYIIDSEKVNALSKQVQDATLLAALFDNVGKGILMSRSKEDNTLVDTIGYSDITRRQFLGSAGYTLVDQGVIDMGVYYRTAFLLEQCENIELLVSMYKQDPDNPKDGLNNSVRFKALKMHLKDCKITDRMDLCVAIKELYKARIKAAYVPECLDELVKTDIQFVDEIFGRLLA